MDIQDCIKFAIEHPIGLDPVAVIPVIPQQAAF